jgi:hypothetical protein
VSIHANIPRRNSSANNDFANGFAVSPALFFSFLFFQGGWALTGSYRLLRARPNYYQPLRPTRPLKGSYRLLPAVNGS